jgi:hypothetical protein
LKRPIILWSSRLTKPDRVGSFLSKDRWVRPNK